MKSVLYKIVLFLKKHLCLPLSQRFEKTFDLENKLKHLSEYICRQLKYHQHRIRSETGMSLEIILDVFKWPIVSLVPLKILILAIAPHFFILVGILCEFTIVLGVYILLPQKDKVQIFLRAQMYTLHVQQYIHQKDLNLCLPLYYYAKVIVELEKNKEFNCVVVLMIRPSRTLKFQFIFGFNNCLWAIFKGYLR